MKRLLCLLAACGGGSDPVTVDAPPVVGPRCTPDAPFGAPVALTGLNTMANDATPRLSADELTIYFSRNTSGPYDLLTASRASVDVDFGTADVMGTVNSVTEDLFPTVTPNGLVLMFDTNRTSGAFHIHLARRTSTSERFVAPQPVPALMDGELHPYVANERALYFTSPLRTEGNVDLWRVEIDSTGATGTPEAITGDINTAEEEVTAVVTPDELRMFFRRRNVDEYDIYTSSRGATTDPWGTATPVPVASIADINEVPSWISPDGCALYFYSTAEGTTVGSEMFVTRRGP